MMRKPASGGEHGRRQRGGREHERDEDRDGEGGRPDHQAPAPDAVDDAPARVGPDGAGHEHRGQRRVARPLAGAELVDEPQRDEGLKAEVDARAQRDDAAQAHERVPVVLVAILVGEVAREVRGLLGGDRPQPGKVAREDDGHDRRDDSQQERPAQAEDQHERRHEDGPEREAGVAAQGEEAHPLPAPSARDLVGEARPFGMEGRDAEAAERHRGRGRRVARRDADEGDAQSGEQDAERHQPRQREAIGAQAEERLDGRRPDARDEDERAGGAVGDPALVDEEGQQRWDRALGHVRAGMPGGEDREAAAIEPRAHRAATPSSAMRSTPSRARSASQPWPRRRWR